MGPKPSTTRNTGKRTKPITARRPRPWGMIGAFIATGVIAATIIGYTTYASWRGTRPWNDRLAGMSGLTDFAGQKPAWLTSNHKPGKLTYAVTPSVGGDHNEAWQNCAGTVYDAPIATEHATHSMEHGAVWITHRSSLPAAQVEKLAAQVRGKDYTLMSPNDQQQKQISLQAWGYQVGVDSADDPRIAEFMAAARINAGPEQGATCSGGITTPGTTPQASAG